MNLAQIGQPNMWTLRSSVFIIAVSVSASTSHGSILYSQFSGTSLGQAGQSYSNPTASRQVAAKFSLSTTDSVRQVRFWGGFFFGGPQTISSFSVRIYADNGGLPTGTPGDPSSTALHTFTVSPLSAIDSGVDFIAGDVVEYTVDLGTGFVASASTTYWLSIQANLPSSTWLWGGQTASGGSAAEWAGGPVAWNTINVATQFQLLGGPSGGAVPVPGAVGLAGLGLAASLRRRRR